MATMTEEERQQYFRAYIETEHDIQTIYLREIRDYEKERLEYEKNRDETNALKTARSTSFTRVALYFAMLSLSLGLIVSTTTALNNIILSGNHSGIINSYEYTFQGILINKDYNFAESIAMGSGILNAMLAIAPLFGIISALLLGRELYQYLLTYNERVWRRKDLITKLTTFTGECFALLLTTAMITLFYPSLGLFLRTIFTIETFIVSIFIMFYMVSWLLLNSEEILTKFMKEKGSQIPITINIIALILICVLLFGGWMTITYWYPLIITWMS